MPSYWRKRSTWWTGETGRALRRHPAIVREVGDYLMSAPTANVEGLYYLPLATIANDTGRQPVQIEKAMEILHGLGFAYYDPINEYVWVREMAREQMGLPLKPGDWQIRAVHRWYTSCQGNLFLAPWHDRYADDCRLTCPRRVWLPSGYGAELAAKVLQAQEDARPSEAPSKGQGTCESSTDTAVILVPDPVVPDPEGGPHKERPSEAFQRFWAVWPQTRRVAKKQAYAEWKRLKVDAALEAHILGAVEAQKRSRQWLKDGGRYIPHPHRWLRDRRFEDVVEGPDFGEATVAAAATVAEFLEGIR